jgi:hypothetical protein
MIIEFVSRVFFKLRVIMASGISVILMILLWFNLSGAETGEKKEHVHQLSPITVMAPQEGVEIDVDTPILR